MKYRVDNTEVFLDVIGESILGGDYCLIDCDDDLTKDSGWGAQGFVVSPILEEDVLAVLQNGVANLVCEGLKSAGVTFNPLFFTLEKYHDYCRDSADHLKVLHFLRLKSEVYNLPINHSILDEKVSEICGTAVSCKVPGQIASGYFFIRIVRPSPYQDNNPPHKDVWLDRLRNAINLYIPLAGSNENSSLSLVPGSHLWMESDIARTRMGALVNGVKYSVPSVVIEDYVLEMIRPEVKQGGAMLFSPYLIHGGAVNLNTDKTRVSLEMRFWRCAE